MLEVLVEVDGRPLSRWACDGVLVSTPTGSTAYAFSAGGPVVWPGVDALLVVPLSAHALFARPLVLSPTSTVVIEVIDISQTHGVVWCDGRRSAELHTGMEIEVTRGAHRLRLARLSEAPFTDRLVHKFGLRVEGWRGAAEPTGLVSDTMLTELRIADLGVISEATIEPHPGLTVVTGETGAGKTMVVTGLGLLLGGRADPKRFAAAPSGPGWRAASAGRSARALAAGRREPAASSMTASCWSPGTSQRSGRSRAYLGGAQVPAPVCAGVTEPLITIHGQSEQIRLGTADRPARVAGPVRRGPVASVAGAVSGRVRRAPLAACRAGPAAGRGPERGPGKSTCCVSGWARSSRSTREPGEDVALAAEARPGCSRPTTSG